MLLTYMAGMDIIIGRGGSMARAEMSVKGKKRKINRDLLKENIELYSIMLPVLVMIFIFCYIPMYGVVIAFQKYTPGRPFLSFDGMTRWVGLKHFEDFINGPYFTRIVGNTIKLSAYNLVFGFPVPIIFALLLNEVTNTRARKFFQTASYLPYFISMVIVAGLVVSFIQTNGLINNISVMLGGSRVAWRTKKEAFPFIYTITNIWKSFGFNSILYMSAITAIDTALYESARLDGATHLQQVWYITLPSIRPTIAIMLIMAVGGLMNSNTDLILLLYTSATYETADVIGTYVYRVGVQGGKFSQTAAIGLFATIINFALVFGANKLSNKLSGTGLW